MSRVSRMHEKDPPFMFSVQRCQAAKENRYQSTATFAVPFFPSLVT